MSSWTLHMAQAGETPGAQCAAERLQLPEADLSRLTMFICIYLVPRRALGAVWGGLPEIAKSSQHLGGRQPWVVERGVMRQAELRFNPSCSIHRLCVSLQSLLSIWASTSLRN